jgi:hypothetical protein
MTWAEALIGAGLVVVLLGVWRWVLARRGAPS